MRDVDEAIVWAEQLQELRNRARELTHDCEAQRRTIHALTAEIDQLKRDIQAQNVINRRVTDERDYWRDQCQKGAA